MSFRSNIFGNKYNVTRAPINGLLRYFKLDEISGPVIDQATFNHAVNNGATTGVTGKINNSYEFNGIDQYVDLGNVIGGLNAFTIGFWFKFLGGANSVLYGSWDTGFQRIIVRCNVNQIQFYTWTTKQAGGNFFPFTDQNNFHFLLCKYDGDKMTMKLDNVLSSAEFAQTGAINSNDNTPETIAKERSNHGNVIVDELFIYDRVTSDVEDDQFWNNGNGYTL